MAAAGGAHAFEPPTYEFRVRRDSAPWVVEAVLGPAEPKDEKDEPERRPLTGLRIVQTRPRRRVLQELPVPDHIEMTEDTISVDTEAPELAWMRVEELSFDGYADLVLSGGFGYGGSGGTTDFAYRFDPAAGRYRDPVELANPRPDPERKIVATGWRMGWCCYWREDLIFPRAEAEPIAVRAVTRSRGGDDSRDPGSYVRGVKAIIKGTLVPWLELKVEERTSSGRMDRTCLMRGDDALVSEDHPGPKALKSLRVRGDPKHCPSFSADWDEL